MPVSAAGVDVPQPQHLFGLFDHRQPAAAGRILITTAPRGGRFGHGHLTAALDLRAPINLAFPKHYDTHLLSINFGLPVGLPVI